MPSVRLPAKPPAHTWQCPALPLWVRVALYAVDHHGRALGHGELRLALDPTSTAKDISRAIRRGITVGLLAHDSTARHLYTRVTGADE